MNKRIVNLLIALLLGVGAFAQGQYKSEKLQAGQVPANVAQDFGSKFPGATLVNWRKVSWGQAYAYEVGFVHDEGLCNARWWSDGTYRWSNALYLGKGLPKQQAAADVAVANNPGFVVESVLKGNVVWGEPHTYYLVTLKKASGKLYYYLNEQLQPVTKAQAGAINDKAAN